MSELKKTLDKLGWANDASTKDDAIWELLQQLVEEVEYLGRRVEDLERDMERK